MWVGAAAQMLACKLISKLQVHGRGGWWLANRCSQTSHAAARCYGAGSPTICLHAALLRPTASSGVWRGRREWRRADTRCGRASVHHQHRVSELVVVSCKARVLCIAPARSCSHASPNQMHDCYSWRRTCPTMPPSRPADCPQRSTTPQVPAARPAAQGYECGPLTIDASAL